MVEIKHCESGCAANEDGAPSLNKENATLYTDLDGTLNLQGIKAKGDIYANNFFFNDGGNIKTLLSETQKAIPSDYLDLYGLNIVNKETGASTFEIDNQGNVNMHSGSISWDAPVIEYQYSVDNKNWHTTEASSDKYRREKQVGGTWGVGYQYKGLDGRPGMNGSDANVDFDNIKAALQRADGIEKSFITADSVGSPNIYSANIYSSNIYAGDGSEDSYTFSKMDEEGFKVYVNGVESPKASLKSDFEGTLVTLTLGAGSSDDENMDKFVISKVKGGAQINFTSADGHICGFRFENGKIIPEGELIVTGCFGA